MDKNGLSVLMAQRLKALREEKHLSHEKLSRLISEKYEIKISKDSLINYEKTFPIQNEGMSVKYLRCFADLYGVSTDYLLGLSEYKRPQAEALGCELGLSEASLHQLIAFNETEVVKTKENVINQLLNDANFLLFLRGLQRLSGAYTELLDKEQHTSPDFEAMKKIMLNAGYQSEYLSALEGTEIQNQFTMSSFIEYLSMALSDIAKIDIIVNRGYTEECKMLDEQAGRLYEQLFLVIDEITGKRNYEWPDGGVADGLNNET